MDVYLFLDARTSFLGRIGSDPIHWLQCTVIRRDMIGPIQLRTTQFPPLRRIQSANCCQISSPPTRSSSSPKRQRRGQLANGTRQRHSAEGVSWHATLRKCTLRR